jgi:hypothetical protein
LHSALVSLITVAGVLTVKALNSQNDSPDTSSWPRATLNGEKLSPRRTILFPPVSGPIDGSTTDTYGLL